MHASTPSSSLTAPLLPTARPLPRRNRSPWRIPIMLWAVGAILVLSAVARLVSILLAAIDPATYPEDVHYARNALPIVSHIVLGLGFTVLGPLQFSAGLRRRWPRFHRLSGRFYAVSAIVIGLSGLYMNEFFPPIGGALKYVSNVLFGVGLIVTTVLAVHHIRRGEVAEHRVWMIRSFAIGLGVATQRIILLPYFMLVGDMSDLAIGVGVWVGWLINLAVAEWVIRRTRR